MIGYAHWEQFSNINDTFKRVNGILVNWHISTGILARIARAILVRIAVEICRITRIRITRLNVSFILLNFSQVCALCRGESTAWIFLSTSIQETSVSRHNGCPNEGLPSSLQYHIAGVYGGYMEAPIIARGTAFGAVVRRPLRKLQTEMVARGCSRTAQREIFPEIS